MFHAWNAQVPAFSIIRNLVHLPRHNYLPMQFIIHTPIDGGKRSFVVAIFSFEYNFVRVQTSFVKIEKKSFELSNIISIFFFFLSTTSICGKKKIL